MHTSDTAPSQNAIIDSFFDNNLLSQEAPRAVIVTGGVGAGKTTIRRKTFAKGYVQLDGGDIFARIVDEATADNVDLYLPTIDAIGQQITRRAIKERRNVAIEHIGDNPNELKTLVDSLERLDYIVDISMIHCDFAEAYRRHLAAIDTDFRYLSCYFTKDLPTKWIVSI